MLNGMRRTAKKRRMEKAIKAWKKGDMIGDGKSVSLNDVEGFTRNK